MRKSVSIAVVFILSFVSLSMAHKFYVAIYQINYAPEKKMLQITSRIFIDDLDSALENRYKKKFHLGEKESTAEEKTLMKQYFASNFTVKINGQAKSMVYLSDEMQDDVLICYFRVTDIAKITSLEISNKLLLDYVTEQQNIIQTNVNGKKESLLLTSGNPSGTITY